MEKPLNKLVSIGVPGSQTCYLNVSEEEAIKRFCERDNISQEDFKGIYQVKSFEFDDEFGAYDVDEKDGFYD